MNPQPSLTAIPAPLGLDLGAAAAILQSANDALDNTAANYEVANAHLIAAAQHIGAAQTALASGQDETTPGKQSGTSAPGDIRAIPRCTFIDSDPTAGPDASLPHSKNETRLAKQTQNANSFFWFAIRTFSFVSTWATVEWRKGLVTFTGPELVLRTWLFCSTFVLRENTVRSLGRGSAWPIELANLGLSLMFLRAWGKWC